MPPNICMPNNANMTINRNNNNNKDAIDFIELSNDATRFLNAVQYRVTLNTRNKRTQRSTDIPNGGINSI